MAYVHIMAGVDVTDEAAEVLKIAREIAAEHGARLSICTVVKPLTHVYGGLDMIAYAQVDVNFEQEAAAQAKARVQALAAAAGIEAADVQVHIGLPAGKLVEVADSLGADLIVLGSHGKHGLGLLLGSTANAVLHGAPCDVLTVRVKE